MESKPVLCLHNHNIYTIRLYDIKSLLSYYNKQLEDVNPIVLVPVMNGMSKSFCDAFYKDFTFVVENRNDDLVAVHTMDDGSEFVINSGSIVIFQQKFTNDDIEIIKSCVPLPISRAGSSNTYSEQIGYNTALYTVHNINQPSNSSLFYREECNDDIFITLKVPGRLLKTSSFNKLLRRISTIKLSPSSYKYISDNKSVDIVMTAEQFAAFIVIRNDGIFDGWYHGSNDIKRIEPKIIPSYEYHKHKDIYIDLVRNRGLPDGYC